MNEISYENECKQLVKLGTTIRKIRKKMGISQESLSDGICDRTAITHLENGKFKLPSVLLLSRICERLGITIDDLFILSFGDGSELSNERRKNINMLILSNKIEKAYQIASNYFKTNKSLIYRQYYSFICGLYLLKKEQYSDARESFIKALNYTTSLEGHYYTVIELRIVNAIIYTSICKYSEDIEKIKSLFNNYVRYLNESHIDDDDIKLKLYTDACFYYLIYELYEEFNSLADATLDACISVGAYEHVGNLCMYKYLFYYIIGDETKEKEYHEKTIMFIKLFDRKDLADHLSINQEIFSSRKKSKESINKMIETNAIVSNV